MIARGSRSLLLVGLFQALCACSSNASDDTGPKGGSGTTGGAAGSLGQGGLAGATAAGSPVGGSASGGVGGSSAGSGGAATAGSAGTPGGTGGAGGAAGGGGSGGQGGGAPSCTPGDGTMDVGAASVLDKKTCLTWSKVRQPQPMTNRQAAKYCDDLQQDGMDDWRVPAPEELVTWPALTTDSTAYITGPTYIPNASVSDMDGCTGNAHSCNIAEYSDNNLTCAWQGVGFQGWVTCVRGTANAGSVPAKFSASMCSPCNGEAGVSFKIANCIPYQ